MNMKKLTHFQTWILFVLFDNDEYVSSRTLIRECCESSFETLDVENTGQELDELVTLKYLEKETSLIPDNPLKSNEDLGYRIGSHGIAYVRQLHIQIRDADLAGGDEEFLSNTKRKYKVLMRGIEKGTLDIKVLISVGLKDIGVVVQLLEIALGGL